jgi:superfamily II DNA or RNA helicase
MDEIATYIGPKGYSIIKENITIQEQKLIRKELTVKAFVPKSSLSKPEPFPIYRESPKKIYVPRFYGLKNYGEPDAIKISGGKDINVAFKGDLRDFQKPIVKKYVESAKTKGGGLLEIHCGAGKCLGIDTPIMMNDGNIKLVQNIKIGDKIMGDDSSPRLVLSLARGQEMMYKIVPNKGDTYIVNESHILSLKCAVKCSKGNKGDIVDICVKDYLGLSHSFHGVDNSLVGYRVPISFPEKEVEMEPYAMGYWLGDDAHEYHQITVMTEPIAQYFTEYASNLGLFIRQGLGNDSILYSLISGKKDSTNGGKNKFLNMLENQDLIQNKHIPFEYKCNSRNIQLEVLAGIIDSNGYLIHNTYEIIQKNERLLNDIIFVARSLGFAAYKKKCLKSDRFITCISGSGLENIPVKIEQKKITRSHSENVLLAPISVQKYRVDDYYGFEIDGNRRFTLGDFTVTHNTVMGLKIISELKKKTLVIVHKEFLLQQWTERINEFLPTAKVGRIQGDIIDIEGKDIVIGMLQSISMRNYPTSLFQNFGLTILDECHHMAAAVFSNALFKIVTKYMLGLSATMDRKDKLSFVFKLFIGDVVYKKEREGNDIVVVKGINYEVDDDKFSKVDLMYNGQVNYSGMIKKLCEFDRRSDFILKVLDDSLKAGPEQQFIVLAHNKSVLKYLHDAIQEKGVYTVGYYVGGMKQKDLKLSEEKKIIIATYAMAEEALDIKTLTSLLMATPKTDVRQAVGRILRKKQSNALVFDIVDMHSLFQRQWKKRCTWYRKQKYTVLLANNEQYDKNMWATLSTGGNRLKHKAIPDQFTKLLQGVCLIK